MAAGAALPVSIPPAQAEVAAFLAARAGRAPIETHISAVFVGADTVWKMKKAVRLPYLDFSTLAARAHFLGREFDLNRAAAPGLYRDVAAIVRAGDGTLDFAPPAAGETVERVLRMAPVPAGDFLDQIAAAGGLSPTLLDALGDAVFADHARRPPWREGDPAAALGSVAAGNAVSARAAGLAEPLVAAWEVGIAAAITARQGWLRARQTGGFVRRCHGDLHLGNLCLFGGRPVPFDALEFDESLARIDVGYDLAFLLMDLDTRGLRAAANRVLHRYLARGGDLGLLAGLAPFLSLRALIRAHIRASLGAAAEAAGLAQAALAYLEPAAARLVAVGGLMGTGKSTLARALAPELGAAPGAVVLRSDEIRKRLCGALPEEHLPPAAYRAEMGARVNATLVASAREALAAGQAVVLDATFLDPALREAAERLAREAGVPFTGLWLSAPAAVLEARVAARTGDASDADVGVLRRALASAPAAPPWMEVPASTADAALAAARRALL